jgi:hypothetical protein
VQRQAVRRCGRLATAASSRRHTARARSLAYVHRPRILAVGHRVRPPHRRQPFTGTGTTRTGTFRISTTRTSTTRTSTTRTGTPRHAPPGRPALGRAHGDNHTATDTAATGTAGTGTQRSSPAVHVPGPPAHVGLFRHDRHPRAPCEPCFARRRPVGHVCGGRAGPLELWQIAARLFMWQAVARWTCEPAKQAAGHVGGSSPAGHVLAGSPLELSRPAARWSCGGRRRTRLLEHLAPHQRPDGPAMAQIRRLRRGTGRG